MILVLILQVIWVVRELSASEKPAHTQRDLLNDMARNDSEPVGKNDVSEETRTKDPIAVLRLHASRPYRTEVGSVLPDHLNHRINHALADALHEQRRFIHHKDQARVGARYDQMVTSGQVAPVLILGFNRPHRLRGVIESLRPLTPPLVLVSLDGPREGHPTDTERVKQCRTETERIDWTPDVRTRFRETNAGLEIAVPSAVTWALEEHDSVIVIEDDVVVGPNFLDFAVACLDTFRDRDDIWHVSGYNVVPEEHLSDPSAPARLSVFPESFAWATWRRAWDRYDPDLTWASRVPIGELQEIVGSTAAAVRWKEIFGDARRRRISTWAYRWIGSIWSERGLCVSPNRNLTTYAGYAEGTHTRRRARWSEFPLEPLPHMLLNPQIEIDPLADTYVGRQVFRGTPTGVVVGAAESLAMEVLRRRR